MQEGLTRPVEHATLETPRKGELLYIRLSDRNLHLHEVHPEMRFYQTSTLLAITHNSILVARIYC